jgi:hypothetical protein
MRKSIFALALGSLFTLRAGAQSPETFKTRLAPVAIDASMKGRIAGTGSATATLAGSKFTVNGTFEDLKSNATMAHIHQGTAPGVRGAKLLDLTVTKGMSGTLSGSFDLTPDQVESLKKGKWYVQIHSEKAPEGNLWGWLMH